MSFDTVKNRCLNNVPEMNIKELEEDIFKQMRRFEKIVRTTFNESMSLAAWSYAPNPSKARREYFEKHKLELVRNHLGILIDLYDYGMPESLKKS